MSSSQASLLYLFLQRADLTVVMGQPALEGNKAGWCQAKLSSLQDNCSGEIYIQTEGKLLSPHIRREQSAFTGKRAQVTQGSRSWLSPRPPKLPQAFGSFVVNALPFHQRSLEAVSSTDSVILLYTLFSYVFPFSAMSAPLQLYDYFMADRKYPWISGHDLGRVWA